jgi:hypothetical protein
VITDRRMPNGSKVRDISDRIWRFDVTISIGRFRIRCQSTSQTHTRRSKYSIGNLSKSNLRVLFARSEAGMEAKRRRDEEANAVRRKLLDARDLRPVLRKGWIPLRFRTSQLSCLRRNCQRER